MDAMKGRLKEMFGLDLRSLALFRVGLSCIILLDLYVRSEHLSEFYTDDGVLPIPAALHLQEKSSMYYWSIHLLSGSYYFNAFLFVLAGIFAVFLFIGWHTTFFTVLSWIMLTSLQNRQEFNLNGGDLLLRLTLFWGIFLPLGDRFSIDSSRRLFLQNHHFQNQSNQFVSMATLAWLIQFSSMYIFSFGLKFGVTWWEGTAVSAALQQEQFLTNFGHFLRSVLFTPEFFENDSIRYNVFSPELGIWILKMATWITLYFEFLIPFLLCVPIFTKTFRITTVISIILMHFSFGMCLEIGFFMYIPCICACSFLPDLFWKFVAKIHLYIVNQFVYSFESMRIYVDIGGNSSLRNLWWHIFISFGAFPEWVNFSTNIIGDVRNTMDERRQSCLIILFQDNQRFTILPDMELINLLAFSPLYMPLYMIISLIPPAHKFVAELCNLLCSRLTWEEAQRAQVFTSTFFTAVLLSYAAEWISIYVQPQSTIFDKTKFINNIISAIIVTILLLYCINWNVNEHLHVSQPKETLFVSDYLRMDQWWGMFSPNPPLDYGWFVIPGLLEDGRMVNLMPGVKNPFEPPSFERPNIISKQYPNQRWRKYMMNLYDIDGKENRLFFGQYLCRSWNYPTGPHKGGERLKTFEILFYEIDPTIPKLNQPQPEPFVFSLWQHQC